MKAWERWTDLATTATHKNRLDLIEEFKRERGFLKDWFPALFADEDPAALPDAEMMPEHILGNLGDTDPEAHFAVSPASDSALNLPLIGGSTFDISSLEDELRHSNQDDNSTPND